jgi:hypothetical protein
MTMRLFALALTLSALIAIGCGGEQQSADEAQTPPAASIPAASAPESAHGGEMTLSGELGCGHCTYQVGTSCSAAVKTADGTVYILEVSDSSELFTERLSGKQVTVVGSMHAHGGEENHVTVASYEMQ